MIGSKMYSKIVEFRTKTARIEVVQESLNEVNNDVELLKGVKTDDEI